MPEGLSGKHIAIALILAIGVGVIGLAVGTQMGATLLGYVGAWAAAIYLVMIHVRSEEADTVMQQNASWLRQGRWSRRNPIQDRA